MECEIFFALKEVSWEGWRGFKWGDRRTPCGKWKSLERSGKVRWRGIRELGNYPVGKF